MGFVEWGSFLLGASLLGLARAGRVGGSDFGHSVPARVFGLCDAARSSSAHPAALHAL